MAQLDIYANGGDGGVEYFLGTSISWANVRNHDGSAAVVNGTGNTFIRAVEATTGTTRYGIARGFIPIDTSGIPDGATITAASLFIYQSAKTNGDDDGNDFAVVVNSTQASTSTLVKEDYDNLGTTEYSSRIDFGNFVSGGYTELVFNATGIAAISKTGYTKFAVREGHDLLNSTITNNTNNDWRVETSGGTNKPFLRVTYTIPPTTESVTKSLKYTVVTNPAITKSLSYEVTTDTSITKSLNYEVVTGNGITKSLKYVATSANQITKSLTYTVLTVDAVTKGLVYDVASSFTLQVDSFEINFGISSNVITKSLRYDILAVTTETITKSLKYTVPTDSSVTKSLSYEIISDTSITKALKYTVLTDTSLTKSLQYEIQLIQAVTKSLKYAILTDNFVTKSLSYEVVSGVAVTKALKYTVLTDVSLTKSLQYEVQSVQAVTKSLKYSVITETAITKSLGYIVTGGESVLKSLKYTVLTDSSVTKSLKYTVTSEQSVSKDLQYVVISEEAINKSLKYTVTTESSVTKSLSYAVVTSHLAGRVFSVLDSTNNDNDLANVGSVEGSSDTPFAASKVSASFDGTNHLKIADIDQTGLDPAGNITLEGSFKFSAWPGTNYFLMGKGQTGSIGYLVHILSSKRLHLQFESPGAVSAFQTNILSDSLLNTHVHFAIAVNVSVPSAAMYVNGSPVTVNTIASSATSIQNSTGDFSIGAYQAGGTYERFYTGLADNIRIWGDIRTAQEIADNYQTSTPAGDNLIAHYTFEQGGAVDLTYKVKASQAVTKSLRYDVEGVTPISITKNLKYTVTSEQSVTKSLKYAVETDSSVTKSLEYYVASEQAISKSLIYKVTSEQEVTRSLEYTVISEEAITKILKYTVISAVTVTKSLDYEIEPSAVNIQKSLKYSLLTDTGITKSLTYDIVAGQAITKALTYFIGIEQTLTKGLEYALRFGTGVTKSLKYIVVSSASVTKSLQYEIEFESVNIQKSLGYTVLLNYSPNEILYLKIGGGLSIPIDDPTIPTWTVNGRPATGTLGQIGYNVELNQFEIFNGFEWKKVVFNDL